MLYKHVRVQQLTSQHQLRNTSTKRQRIMLIPLQSVSSTTGSWLVKNIKCQDVRKKGPALIVKMREDLKFHTELLATC